MMLMLVAHPDDEVIFGYEDIINSTTFVICFTNRDNPIRSGEFRNCLQTLGQQGLMLSYPDSRKGTWPTHSTEMLCDDVLSHLAGHNHNHDFDLIVSHDARGEYGHIQHRRVHNVALMVSQRLGVPFQTFYERFLRAGRPKFPNQRLEGLYPSQQIETYFKDHVPKAFIARI